MTVRNEQNVPIDIHSSKLLEWLVSRRHCGKDWQAKCLNIRDLIANALQDMPEHERIVQLLSGTCSLCLYPTFVLLFLDYFTAKELIVVLKETEANSKNIFGSYSSQRMKDWQEIIVLYEKEGTYLGESAQLLQRLIQYEIPAVKKSIQKGFASVEECNRKHKDYERQAREAERVFDQQCKKLNILNTNIKTMNIRNELLKLAQNLPESFETLATACTKLKEPIEFYAKFRDYVAGGEAKDSASVLGMLGYLLDKGNTTYYEYVHKKTPLEIIPLEMEIAAEEITDADNDVEIDFGEEIDMSAAEDQAIDFGQFTIEEDNVSFGIETIGEDTVLITNSPSPNSGIDKSGIARGQDAFTILEHSSTLCKLIDDLMELSAFVTGRSQQMSLESHSDIVLASQMSRDSTANQLQLGITEAKLNDWANVVASILGELQNDNRRHLLKIRASKTYLDSLTEELNSKRAQIGKYEQLALIVMDKGKTDEIHAHNMKPQLESLITQTRHMQKMIEQEISRKYDGRPVNIVGGITAALAST